VTVPPGRRAIAAAVAVVGGLAGCAGGTDAPAPTEYADAASIAAALNAGGLECTFVDTTASEPSTAESSGRCTGADFSAELFVFASQDDLEEAILHAYEEVCDLGIDDPTYVGGTRWVIGSSEPVRGPAPVDAQDLAEATGGALTPVCD
jgi:hypothetical protein